MSYLKDLHKKQLKRSKQYRKLLGIAIPNRTDNPKEVIDDLWYIIWEENLLKPKIFKYSFVTDYFAIHFANKHLQDKPYYIILGKDLKQFGILKVNIGLRYTGTITKGTLPHKYDFPKELSLQRKKTLRTMYRRNLRRLLMKLLKKKNKKTMDIYVKTKIDDKPGAFFKKLGKNWYYELTYSVTFKTWYVREESWRIDEITKAANFYPRYTSEICNILICLEEHYSDEVYDYKNMTYVSMAIYIWKTYKDRINKYMVKKGLVPKLGLHSIEQAWVEMVYRGFIPSTLLPKNFDSKDSTYIKCFTPGIDLVFPKEIKNAGNDAPDILLKFGIIGCTGIHYPKK